MADRAASPTPGAANAILYEGTVEPPEISVAGGFCTEPFTVTITTATPEATIYYSLDGSDPLNPSTPRGRSAASMGSVYTTTLKITKTTTLKAVAIKSGWKQSSVSMERYIFLGADLLSFTSPLPIGVIDTLGKTVSTVQVPAFGFFVDTGAEGRAALTGPIDFVGPAAINARQEFRRFRQEAVPLRDTGRPGPRQGCLDPGLCARIGLGAPGDVLR
jgi:hypothetical protein